MKIHSKYISKLVIALSTLGVAASLSPALRAQVQSQKQSDGTSAQASPETQKRLEDLEKEVTILQREIITLKESDSGTPTMRTAALVEPIPQGQAPPAGTAAAAAPAPATPAPSPLVGFLGPMTFSGYVDGYYGFNFNQPGVLGSTPPNGVVGNALQFFDQNTNQFSLNSIEAVVDRAPDATAGGTGRAGYHIGIIYGQAAEAINGGSGTDASNLALKEAYVDYIAPIGKGLTFTFGKFVTPMGEEVIESNANINYSRSILFQYAIPYFHFGMKALYTFNPKWNVTGYIVNGWNNTQEVNTGKTYGGSIGYTPNKYVTIAENYMAGPLDDAALYGALGKPNDNWRQLEDAVITITPNAKWTLIANGDYGYGDKFPISTTTKGITTVKNSQPVDWWGIAGYGKYTISGNSYFAVRYEYFSDPQGLALFGAGSLNGHVQEGTATYAYNWTSALQTRFEFREDFSNRDIFLKGSRFVETEPIAEIGVIYTFSSANIK